MHHLAVLGRERSLCLAELESVGTSVVPLGDCALLGTKPEFQNLGGSLKLANIFDQPAWRGWDNLSIDLGHLPASEGKTVFGVSFYGPPYLLGGLKNWSFELKKKLRKHGGVRLVLGEKNELTAAQLKFNQVLEKGFELVIATDGNRTAIAHTEAFQDIDWYSKRDYDRPARSAKVGMLPPKLAQIMINISKAQKVYDPFCGTGVILQESLLMGKPAAGSDLEPKMIDFTLQNLSWLAGQVTHKLPEYFADVSDARTAKIPAGFSVVCEGYLGPPLVKPPTPPELSQLKTELNQLYWQCLQAWNPQLQSGQGICLGIPCWRVGQKFEILPLIDQISDLGYNLVRFKHANSERLIYARPDQIVGRQLLALTKQ